LGPPRSPPPSCRRTFRPESGRLLKPAQERTDFRPVPKAESQTTDNFIVDDAILVSERLPARTDMPLEKWLVEIKSNSWRKLNRTAKASASISAVFAFVMMIWLTKPAVI